MAGVQGIALALAVSNVGGLGALPCALLSSQQMDSELSALRSGTSRSYNVNFFCHIQPDPIHPAAPAFPLASAAAEQQADTSLSPLWCGQNPMGYREIPAAQPTFHLATGTHS